MTFFKKTALASLICTAIILVSWTKSANSDVKQLTDEAVFNGLIFMKGEVVGLVPELKETAILQAKLTQATKEEKGLTKMQASILQRIQTKHPGYLAHFRKVMTSGNHYAISAELQNANTLVNDALGDVLGIDLNKAASKKDEVAKLLGSKMQQLKDLYKQYKVGDLTEAEFKSANATILADKNGELAKLFPNQDLSIGNVTSTNSGYCLTVNVGININVGVNVNVGVNINIGANVNVGVNVNIFRNINFWWGDSQELPMETSEFIQASMVNSIAERLKA